MAKVTHQNPGYHLGSIGKPRMQQVPIMNMQTPLVQQPMNQPIMSQPQAQPAADKRIKL